ncbi:3-hydroxyisobutyrate dehydrogenase family protein [hydrothermal vent metagenome]|uniref:3-hydroxyisobutyrate dehydrogenase family protein n=1 Tax=hydrothermal vent metagenome TaxID=652676 RepID=A0A3B0X3R5_9ZZZZ
MKKNITVLGTGAMGSRLAAKLIEAGYSVSVYNRNKGRASAAVEIGATYYETPGEAVASADIVISMLTDDHAASGVWLNKETGAIWGMKPDAIAIESSTLSIACITNFSAIFAEQGIAFLDAPVVGSRPQAEAGALIFLLGGSHKALHEVTPVLNHLSSAVYHLGENGAGAMMKLAVNAYFGVQVAAFGEVIGWLQKSGIDKQQSTELLSQLPVISPALQGIAKLVADENYQPFFPLDLVKKDFSYMLKQAVQAGSQTPCVAVAQKSFQQAIEKGYGSDNIAGVARLWVD